MKKFLILISLACSLVLASGTAYGQATITTRKAKISDFTAKTTRMVLTGDAMFDSAFKEEVGRRWMISPFEFCTQEEFEASKNSSSYYFLAPLDSRRKKEAEPGIAVLSLIKGGPETGSADKTTFEVLSLPYAAAEDPSGREFVFLPALLDIIQGYMREAMLSDAAALAIPGRNTNRLAKASKMKVVLSKDDIASSVNLPANLDEKNVVVMEEEDADEVLTGGEAETLVSYVVAPSSPQKGGACYVMLISADTHEIYYCNRHPAKDAAKTGFLADDIKLITIPRK